MKIRSIRGEYRKRRGLQKFLNRQWAEARKKRQEEQRKRDRETQLQREKECGINLHSYIRIDPAVEFSEEKVIWALPGDQFARVVEIIEPCHSLASDHALCVVQWHSGAQKYSQQWFDDVPSIVRRNSMHAWSPGFVKALVPHNIEQLRRPA